VSPVRAARGTDHLARTNEIATTPRPFGRGSLPTVTVVNGTECRLTSRWPEDVHPQEVAMADPITTDQETPLVEETLVEEVSIDGMCGVY